MDLRRGNSGARPLAAFILVSMIAGFTSAARLLLSAGSSFSQLVWAEDGLFALCIRKVGLLDCFTDPFAGYLLGVPRLLAGITAQTPLESWGVATNVIAAVGWGLLSGISAAWLVYSGVTFPISALIALLPVVIPLTGLEAVNSIGSIYMPLLYTSTLVVALGWAGRVPTWIAMLLTLSAVMTIPTAAVLGAVLWFSYSRRRISANHAKATLVALLVGGVVQVWVINSASDRRNILVSMESLGFWITDMTTALLTLWPGMTFGSTSIFGFFVLSEVPWTGLIVTAGLMSVGLRCAAMSDRHVSVAGVLVLTGLAYSFIPTATGYSSNRYFVSTVLGVAAAALLVLDSSLRPSRRWVLYATVALFGTAWMSTMPASAWRALAAPPWQEVVDRVENDCSKDPTAPAIFTFSPEWPQEGVTELQPPSNQFASCAAVGFGPDR